jgi:glycosyltransferase involved in cell wall biosynthesis
MKIGIDISQMAYEGTGVANYITRLIENLIAVDTENEYVLFFSSLRKNFQFSIFNFKSRPKNVKIKTYKLPLSLLDVLWNKLHIFPIEWFIGDVDIFITSDWVEPPTVRAKKATIVYDLIVYKYPEETDKKIVDTQKRKLNWAVAECSKFLCISEATKRDLIETFNIDQNKIYVTYPGA